MPLEVKPLSPQNRTWHSEMVIGEATCPLCKQDEVMVVNDQGPKGDSRFHYLENHYPEDDDHLCAGSEKMLADFE